MSNPYTDIRTRLLPGLGRKNILQTVLSKIERGEHVSIVSPRYMGKSCLLRSLIQQPPLRQRFESIALCDVRREQLPNNDAFFAFILKKLETDPQISKKFSEEWKNFTKPDPGISAWTTLYDLAKGMADEGVRMLIILDGLDELAFSSTIDEGAWNNLNSLIDVGGVQFITASRDELGDICLDPQSRGSLFFQRFADSVALPPVDLAELPDWLNASSGGAAAFERAAQTELLAQSGGHPKLLAALLSRLPTGASGTQINCATDELTQNLASEVVSVFNELQLDWREALSTFDEAGRTTPQARRALLARCLVRVGRADRLEQNCRMIAKLAEGSRPGESTMRALFGTEEVYFKNATHALRLRLLALAGTNQNQIFRCIARIIDNLDDANFAMNGGMRTLEDEVIGVVERLVGNPFPALQVQNPPRAFKSSGQDHRSHNVRVVDCLTREECGYSNPKLPRSIYLLLSSIHGAGNYATHRQGQTLSPGFAHALATSALELAAEMKCSGLIH